jgi:hypothetical protein
MEHSPASQLPALFGNDDSGEYSGQLIRGVRLKFVDKIWSAADGTPLAEDDRFLVVGTGVALQRWAGGLPEVITERPLPSVDALNASVPKSEWPIGKFSNQPEPPWRHVWYARLVRPHDATTLTFVNGTAGSRVAVQRLRERTQTMSALRGCTVAPIVKLSWAMMPSSFGPRPRPDFVVEDWRSFGGDQPAQIAPPTADTIGKPVAPVTTAEELNDEIGF